MFPFVISYDGPDNASSVAHLLDAPAGKHGCPREGWSVCHGRGSDPLPCDESDRAGELPGARGCRTSWRHAWRRFGINCVRLHAMDTWYINFMTRPTRAVLAGRHPDAAEPRSAAVGETRLPDRGFQEARHLRGHEPARGPDAGRARRLCERQGPALGGQRNRAVRTAHDRAREGVRAEAADAREPLHRQRVHGRAERCDDPRSATRTA